MKTTKNLTDKVHKMTIEEKNAFKIWNQKVRSTNRQFKNFLAIRRQREFNPSEQVEFDRLWNEMDEDCQRGMELLNQLSEKRNLNNC